MGRAAPSKDSLNGDIMNRVLVATFCTFVLVWACSDEGTVVPPNPCIVNGVDTCNAPGPGVATIEPAKDNTIYEDAGGLLSNGAGENLFIGLTSGTNGEPFEARRALMMFDIAAAVPAGATIDSVLLTLRVGNRGPARDISMVTLHRLTTDWGEGGSQATPPEGAGTQAFLGDATWLHTFYDTAMWATVGGDFVAPASDTTPVEDSNTFYTWGNTDEMVSDVQGWLDGPSTNFGWIMIGNEMDGGSAKQLSSRQNMEPTFRPKLEIHYTP